MVRQARWPTFEEWRDWGMELEYDERKSGSFKKSEDKGERSWYARGVKKRWVRDFKFDPRGRWPDFESWRDHGIEEGYDGRNPSV